MKLTDFEYIFPTTNTAKEKIVLAGMLSDGPVGQGFTIKPSKAASILLGDNRLTQAYTQLKDSGIPNDSIVFYRMNGRHARLVMAKDGMPFFQFVSVGAHEQDNNLSVTVSSEGITLQSNYAYTLTEADGYYLKAEVDMKPNFSQSYRFDDYPFLSDLAAAINQDTHLGLVDMAAQDTAIGLSAEAFAQQGVFELREATSESHLIQTNADTPNGYADDYIEKFQRHIMGYDFDGRSYTNVMEIETELLYFPDIFIDELPEIGEYAGRIAQQKSLDQKINTVALFQASPVPGKRELQEGEYMQSDTTFYNIDEDAVVPYTPWEEKDQYIEKLNNLYTVEQRGYEYMRYVQVLVGEDDIEGKYRPGAVHYAQLYLSSPFYEGLTNVQLPEFTRPRSELNKSDIASLQAKGYICIVPSIRKNAVCSNVQTLALKNGSGLDRFANQRLLGYITKDIEQLIDGYIGSPKIYFNGAEVEKILRQYLEQFTSQGHLQSYTVTSPGNNSLSRVTLDISLVLYNEVQTVQGTLRVEPEGWDIDIWNNNV